MRRRLGGDVAIGTVVLLSIMPNLVAMSASLVHDILFTTLVFAAVFGIAHWQQRGALAWLGVGAIMGLAIVKVLVDTEDDEHATYRDKLSAASDEQGPLAFLSWPRCFADGGKPSRFTVYCRPPASR